MKHFLSLKRELSTFWNHRFFLSIYCFLEFFLIKSLSLSFDFDKDDR